MRAAVVPDRDAALEVRERPVPTPGPRAVRIRVDAVGRDVTGWASGTPIGAEETLAFSDRRDIRPRAEAYDLEDAATAYRRMIDSDARFRAVLTP